MSPQQPHPLPSTSHRPGKAILESTDPSTAALRAWAQDKETQYPGQDGSINNRNPGMMQAMVWGGAITLPRKGDTLPPPDERLGLYRGHGEVEYVGPAGEEEEGKGGERVEEGKGKGEMKKSRFSGLFSRKRGKAETGAGREGDGNVR